MRRQNLFCLAVLLSGATALPAVARPQSQDNQSQSDSVADAARKARAEKKASNEKHAPVITDDILKPSAPVAPAGGGDAAGSVQTGSAGSAASNTNGAAPSAQGAGDKAKTDAELKELQAKVAEAQKAVDLAKRELALEQDNLYSKPDYQTDAAGKAKVDGLNQQVADKQQTLEDLKARLAEAQAKADAQAPASETPPAGPPQL